MGDGRVAVLHGVGNPSSTGVLWTLFIHRGRSTDWRMDDETGVDLEALDGFADDTRLDEVLRVLSDRRARFVLGYLADHREATLDRLADVVTGLEASATDTVATPEDRHRTRAELYHVVLPKLDRLGFLEFEPADHTVTEADVPREVYALIERAT